MGRSWSPQWEPYQELFQGVIVCAHSDFASEDSNQASRRRSRARSTCTGRLPGARSRVPSSSWTGTPDPTRRPGLSSAAAGSHAVIEFGWVEPDTAFMPASRSARSRAFDGCVFPLWPRAAAGRFHLLGWGRPRAFLVTTSNRPSATSLRHLGPKPFFDFLRFNVTPGDLDWFDDHVAAFTNARLAAGLCLTDAAGEFMLDTEAWDQGKVFDFSSSATRTGRGIGQAAHRWPGACPAGELMAAFQAGFPGNPRSFVPSATASIKRPERRREVTARAKCPRRSFEIPLPRRHDRRGEEPAADRQP